MLDYCNGISCKSGNYDIVVPSFICQLFKRVTDYNLEDRLPGLLTVAAKRVDIENSGLSNDELNERTLFTILSELDFISEENPYKF